MHRPTTSTSLTDCQGSFLFLFRIAEITPSVPFSSLKSNPLSTPCPPTQCAHPLGDCLVHQRRADSTGRLYRSNFCAEKFLAAFKVAGSTRLRLSALIRQKPSECVRDSVCAGRVASRRYGTVASTSDRPQQQPPQRSSHDASSTGGTNSAPRSWLNAPHADQQAPKTRSPPRFYVPSVLLPPEAAEAPAAHKIYILGDDERSRFIAHALSGVYDSVERIGWRKTVSPKYRNIEHVRPRNHRGAPKVGPLAVTPRVLAQDDDTHIHQLIMTGHGHEAAQALRSVSHRVDKDTTVCLMNDGLGVLEDVKQKIFAGTDSVPNFLLGHMSHKLVFDRRYDSVRELRNGVTKFSATDMAPFGEIDTAEARLNLIKNLRRAADLKSSFTPFDNWLRFKLPSVIFNSVVEPVCVLLEIPYEGLMQNPAALRMLHHLLDEIIVVLDNMPEIKESSVIQDFVHGNGIRRNIYNQIHAKRSHPSDLRRRIENGLPTDVEYMNGFFLRQGRHLGVDLPMNTIMRDVIKARQSLAIERLNSYIPVEETSIPSASHFRYRRSPR